MDRERLTAALAAMRIAPDGAALDFVGRLARENGWGLDQARAVDREYRRFLLLAATADTPVTPSDAVDQAWHLHLTYSRHYWGVLCGEILGRPLHHGPTAGGGGEAARYRGQYAATLAAYRAAFGVEPPAAIWPAVAARFAGRARRVDARTHWIVPKPPLRAAGALAACAALAGCAMTVEDAGNLIGLLALVAVGLAMVWVERRRGKRRKAAGESDIEFGGDGDGDGGCGGDSGCGGCGGD